jgi:hypothetical protein
MAKNRVSYFPTIVNIANRNCCVFLAFLHKNLKNLRKKQRFWLIAIIALQKTQFHLILKSTQKIHTPSSQKPKGVCTLP